MKTFLTVLLFISSWLIPPYLLFFFYSLSSVLLYGVFWIVFVFVMAAASPVYFKKNAGLYE